MGITANEFPLLSAVGLYVKDTAGNGNCLFNALSDQLYGDQSKHAELRSRVIRHMRENATYYKQFIEVHPGGGTRRNPKRKNAGGFSTPFSNAGPTATEIDRTFEGHLREMARGGTYGDNMEIVAFSSAFKVDVKIYQRDFAFVVACKDTKVVVPVVHIAYHAWEHYSSIRNVVGPHTGLPQINVVADYGATEAAQPEASTESSCARPKKVETVAESLPNVTNSQSTVRKMSDDSVRDVILKLIDSDDKSTTPSTQGSSSVERDSDSEDEDPIRGPNKRRDRRLSQAARVAMKENDDRNHLTHRPKSGYHIETEEYSSKPRTESTSTDEAGEDDWRGDAAGKDSESASFSTSASDISVACQPRSGAVRLKLSQPKKERARVHTPSSNHQRPAMGVKAMVDLQGKAQARYQNHPKHRRLIQRKQQLSKAAPNSDDSDYKKAMIAGTGTKPLMTTQGNERTPTIETHIKVLYI